MESADKVDLQMTPMIDCVFQLLIFFMLTLKIIEPEGDFSVNMPVVSAAEPQVDVPVDIKVRLVADADGSLADIRLGQRRLGSDEEAFDELNRLILRMIGPPGNPLAKETEVEIDADYGLNWNYTMRAISACTGRLDPKTKRIVRYIEKIKFAPPKKPAA